jgi:acyl-homoserine lactone acylase PvdQ
VRDALLAWNGSTAADSVGAAAYHVFRQQLTRLLLAQRFGETDPLVQEIARAEPVPGLVLARFLDRTRGSAGRDLITDALEDSWTWLAQRVSNNPKRWVWGRLRGIRFAHAFEQLGSGGLYWIGRGLGIGPIAVPGDPDSAWTVHHGGLLQGETVVGPGVRYQVDLADVYHSQIQLAGGQSGYRGSRYYADGLEDWLRARPRLLWMHPSDVDDHEIGAWQLDPLPQESRMNEAAPADP